MKQTSVSPQPVAGGPPLPPERAPRETPTIGRVSFAFGIAGAVVVGVLLLVAALRGRDVVLVVTVVLALITGLWTLCGYLVRRRDLKAGGWRLAEALLAREAAVAAEARATERASLAREMHDSLGHKLTLVAVRAGALEVSTEPSTPMHGTIADLRMSTVEAIESLNDIVSMLADDAFGSSSQTDLLRDVDRIVRRARDAGLDVRTDLDLPEPSQLGDATTRAMVRIVEESLTNVARHAPGAEATLILRGVDAHVQLTVADSGATGGRNLSRGGGRGLAALAERVRLLDGTFSAGPDGEGFCVDATLPFDARVGRAASAGAAPIVQRHTELKRRVRHSRRVFLASTTAVLLLGALTMLGYVAFVTYASVLDPGDYRQITVGQSQSRAEEILPPVQMLEPPQVGADRSCRYYEPAANVFVREEVFEICFADGVVTSHRVIPSP